MALGISSSLFAERIFAMFDENRDGLINFNEFIKGLSVLSHKATVEEKVNCIILNIYTLLK